MEDFDGEVFESQVRGMAVQAGGDIEFQLVGGGTQVWRMPPKPEKPKPAKSAVKRPKNIFDGKIFCGQCGRRFGRTVSQTVDGGHLYWYCRAKSNHGETCDSVNYPDSEIKDILCGVMGWEEFDGERFTETVERMDVRKSGSIDIRLKDGSVKTYKTLKLRNNRHESTSTDEFTGKIRCASCGNIYHRYSCYGKYVYWRCSGKHKVRTECSGQDFADSSLRKVSAYMMGMDAFDGGAFLREVGHITALEDGSLEYTFTDGRTALWQKA